jgi:hypothetical protein
MKYLTLMSQQPQTLAFALLDSLVGQLAWNEQLLLSPQRTHKLRFTNHVGSL